MKSLDRYIIIETAKEQYKNYFGGITDDVIEKINDDPYYDFIFDNLQTHDKGLLMKALKRKLGDNIRECSPEDFDDYDGVKNSECLYIKCISDVIAKRFNRIRPDDDIRNILDFYNYFITWTQGNYIVIEPTFPKKRTDYVYDDCKGVVYHITRKESLDSIKRNGLRIKDGVDYREFPSRIFLFAYEPRKTNDILDEIKKSYDDMANGWVSFDDMAVIRIKMPLNTKNRIPFYNDPAIDDDNTIFTYTAIPAKYIDRIYNL